MADSTDMVKAVVRDGSTLEIESPTLGRRCIPVDELVAIMDRATEAIEDYNLTNKNNQTITIMTETTQTPTSNVNPGNVAATPASAAVVNPAPAPAEVLTYRSILFKVLGEAAGPLTIKDLCTAAKPLIDRMGAKGKTPMDSFKSKVYIAAKNGDIVRVEGDKFTLPAK